MKKIFSIFLVLIIFINATIPSFAFAATAPEEPPEMPDWWREKYGDRQIEHEDFKNKEIKTIKPPKKIANPTPVGIAAGLALEYLVSQNEDLQAVHDDFWEQVDKVDKELGRWLYEEYGIRHWDDVFRNLGTGFAYVTDTFIDAVNDFFDFSAYEYEIDYENFLNLIEPNIAFEIRNRFDGSVGDYGSYNKLVWIGPVFHTLGATGIGSIRVYFIYEKYSGSHYWLYSAEASLSHEYYHNVKKLYIQSIQGELIGTKMDDEKYDEYLADLKQNLRDRYFNVSNKISRGQFLDLVKQSKPDLKPKTYRVNNLGYLPNPYGSRLNDPNKIEELGEYETGIIEIDNQKYHIINVPNPNHTPHLEPTHPNYVPTHYPIIRPIIPVPNSPNVDDPAHPANPNNPYSPNNPNPQEVPEIPLIPDITPSPQPSPQPTPDPSPEPSPEPSPDPSVPQIPRAPEDDFGEGKECGELNLDLKSIDLFTTKFPFSIPWDVFRAIEAAFGKMGSEEPKFVLSFISDDTVLEIPQFIKDWVPLVRSIILFMFDVSVIYALYRWFGGAS